jgi:hypothetical protein
MLLGWRAGAAEAGTVSRVVAYVFFAWSPVIHYRLPQRNSCRPLVPSACTFAQVSRSPTVRLNTAHTGVPSGSAAKYPVRSIYAA